MPIENILRQMCLLVKAMFYVFVRIRRQLRALFGAAAARKLLIDRPAITYYVNIFWFVSTRKRDMDLRESRRVFTLTDKRHNPGGQARGFLHRRVKVVMNYGF